MRSRLARGEPDTPYEQSLGRFSGAGFLTSSVYQCTALGQVKKRYESGGRPIADWRIPIDVVREQIEISADITSV